MFLLAAVIFAFQPSVLAGDKNLQNRAVEVRALILHDLKEENSLREVNMLDALVGQFAHRIEISPRRDFDLDRLDEFSHIIYFGEVKKRLPKKFTRAVDTYGGSFFAIGYNAERLGDRFTFIRMGEGYVLLSHLNYLSPEVVEPLASFHMACNIKLRRRAETLASATSKGGTEVPFIVRRGDNFYCSARDTLNPVGKIITEAFNSFFNQEEPRLVGYLRLEDVHPNTDPILLKEQARYLAKKGIPYMGTVIPAYIHGDTEYHLSHAPRLVKVLQYMQANGASIVLHGYRHQYRDDETGEGFEFWDVEYDRPVYQESTARVLTEEDFSSGDDYLDFIKEGEAFERAYIKSALRKGIEELVAYRLYPVAFEAPHYAMSQRGYKVVSEHFNAYVGSLQLTDDTWKVSSAPLTESRPAFLHGMTVYPETLGYVDENLRSDPFRLIERTANRNKGYTKAYLSVFYHPYLGIDGLKRIVGILEGIDGLEWLDLKEEDLAVEMGEIKITTRDGGIIVDKPFIASEFEKDVFLKSSVKWFALIIFGGPYLAFILTALFRRRSSSQGSAVT